MDLISQQELRTVYSTPRRIFAKLKLKIIYSTVGLVAFRISRAIFISIIPGY